MIDDLDKKLEEYKLEIEKAEKEEAERRRIAEEAERQHEEAEKELRRQKKFQQENDDFNSGRFYDNLGTYRHYLEQGHKPTYESCVHVKECKPRRYYSSDKLNKVAPVEVLKAAIEFGLSKDDATKLLSICLDEVLFIYKEDEEWLRKAISSKKVQLSDRDIEEVRSKMKVLIEDGHADVSKFPISKIKELYCATHILSTCVGRVPTGRRVYSSKHDAYYDEQKAIYHYETIEYKQPARDIFILLLQNGYKPETVADKKDFVYLYGPAKEHLEKLEQEKRKQQELIENFAKGVYYINLDEGLPVGKCRVPMSFSYDGNECSLLYLFKDTLGSK